LNGVEKRAGNTGKCFDIEALTLDLAEVKGAE